MLLYLLLGELGFALVGDLEAVAVAPDVDDSGDFAGHDHSAVAEEVLAEGVGLAGSGEAAVVVGVVDAGVGTALEEGCGSALRAHGGAFEPGFPAEGSDHLVDEDAAALLGVSGGLGRRGAGEFGRLRACELGREESGGEDGGG